MTNSLDLNTLLNRAAAGQSSATSNSPATADAGAFAAALQAASAATGVRVSATAAISLSLAGGCQAVAATTLSDEEIAANLAKRIAPEDSAVADFKRRNPRDAGHVETQVALGKGVLVACGADAVDTTHMSMEEYRAHIARILDSIPFDASRPFDEESINISDEGWEQMKNDPEYEAWVIGYNKENRSVRNPFAGLQFGAGSCYAVEHFGASIDEHRGVSWSKTYGGTAAGARDLFNEKTPSGSMVKRGDRADDYPPKDYDLRRQQEKAREEKARLQKEWEEAYYQRRELEQWFAEQAQSTAAAAMAGAAPVGVPSMGASFSPALPF